MRREAWRWAARETEGKVSAGGGERETGGREGRACDREREREREAKNDWDFRGVKAARLRTPPSSLFASSALSSIPNPRHRDDRGDGDSGGGGGGGGGTSYRNLASVHPCPSADRRRPILTPHLSHGGLFPYHHRRIDGDTCAPRGTAPTSPKRRSVRTQGSLSPRTFATRLRSLTPHSHTLSLSLFLFLYSPASCLSRSFSLSPLFPLFPLGGRRAKLVTGEARVVTVHRSTSTEVLP